MPGGSQDQIGPVLEAKARAEGGDPIFTLSSGVVLRAKKLAPMLMTGLVMALEETKPKPPVVVIASKGREEENPNDPDYVERLSVYQGHMATVTFNAFVLEGTVVIEAPSNLPGMDDEDWLDRMRLLGKHVQTKAERYVAWFESVACADAADIGKIMEEVGRLSSVSERDVSAAVQNFRGS